MYKYILNPIDKKKINIKSKLGKKILQNYLEISGGSSSSSSMALPRAAPDKKGKKKKVDLPSLEKIDKEEAIPTLTQSQKLCPIKGLKFCKDIVPGFQSPFNILNYISHDDDDNLNDINFENTQYIRIETKHSGFTGSYGGIVDNIFKNDDTKNQIIISEKIMRTHIRKSGGSLEELKLLEKYPYLLELCPHIIPIKILDNRVYMLRGNGDLNDLIEKIDINAGIAHQIVNCIKKTLLCLLEHDIYYFDLKPGNIIYQCIDDIMYIWLIDLGSMLPGKHGDYLATYPHPVINCLRNKKNKFGAGIITKEVYGFNLSQKKKHEKIKDIYAYQLSQLFFNLINLNSDFSWKYITKKKKEPLELSNTLKSVVEEVENSGYKYRLIKNYTGVFKEIINCITEEEEEEALFGPTPKEYPPIPLHEEFWL